MPTQATAKNQFLWSAVISAGVTLIFFVFQYDLGLNIWDEGFLWYGVKRTLHGEVPIRDFQAYEPGRYYWLAFWSLLFGEKRIIGVRVGCAILQWLSLTLGVFVVAPLFRSRITLALLALALSLWMAPPYLIFERAIALASSAWCVYVLQDRSRRNAFLSGIFLGLLWLAGRNMLLYGLASTAILGAYVLYLDRPSLAQIKKTLVLCIGGGIIGGIPMLAFLLLVPGFLRGYWDNVVLNTLYAGSTNLFIPIPWPWTISWNWSTLAGWNQIAVSICFVLFPALAIIAGYAGYRKARARFDQRQAILAGVVAIVLPWLHYPYSRADIYHLAPVGAPTMILLAALFAGYASIWLRAVGVFAVIAISVLSPSVLQPYLAQKLFTQEPYGPYQIGDETLILDNGIGNLIANVRSVYARLIKPNESALIVPYYPGLYAVLEQRSPIYESFSLHHARPEKQQEMIRDMEMRNTQLVFYWELYVDNDPNLGFVHTHPEVWRYIQEHFKPIDDPEFAGKYQVFRRNPS